MKAVSNDDTHIRPISKRKRLRTSAAQPVVTHTMGVRNLAIGTVLNEPEEPTFSCLKSVSAFRVGTLRKSVHRFPPKPVEIITDLTYQLLKETKI